MSTTAIDPATALIEQVFGRPDDIMPTIDVRDVPVLPRGLRSLWDPTWDLSERTWALADAINAAGDKPTDDERKAFGHGVASPIREGLTAVVNGLARDRARYAVGYVGGGKGFTTDLKARHVMIDGGVLMDRTLSHDLRIGVLLGATLHESGHVRYDRTERTGLEAAFPQTSTRDPITGEWRYLDDVDRKAPVLANLIGDVRLEHRLNGVYPAYRALFPITCWWVAKEHPTGRIGAHWRTADQAINFAIAATRYDGYTRWANEPLLLAERAWWQAWAARWQDTGSMVPAVREALDHIRAVQATLPEPEPEPPTEPGRPGDGPGGDPGPSGQECTCGCSVLAFAKPVLEGCTDEHCQCHGGGGSDGEESPEPSDEPPTGGSAGDDESTGGTPGEDPDEVYRRGTEPETGEPGGGRSFGISAAEEHEGDEAMPGQEVNALNSALPLHPEQVHPADARNFSVSAADHIARVEASATKTQVDVVRNDGRTLKVAIVPGPATGNEGALSLDSEAVGALSAAFRRKRTLRERTSIQKSGGKIMPGKMYRLQLGNTAIFSRKDDPSPDRLDVHILVDASGSMTGRIGAAARVAGNLTEALLATRTARVHVWAHNDGVGPGNMTLWDIFDSRRGQKVTDIGHMRAGGSNLDGTAIAAVAAVASKDRDERERTMILVCSDGAPCEDEAWVASVVHDTEREGIPVISVAIDGGLTAVQEAMYGHDSIVSWKGDWDSLGVDMADALGRKA